jgi:hypothetical protein
MGDEANHRTGHGRRAEADPPPARMDPQRLREDIDAIIDQRLPGHDEEPSVASADPAPSAPDS